MKGSSASLLSATCPVGLKISYRSFTPAFDFRNVPDNTINTPYGALRALDDILRRLSQRGALFCQHRVGLNPRRTIGHPVPLPLNLKGFEGAGGRR